MTNNNFKEILIEPDLEKIMEQVEVILRESYSYQKDSSESVWEEGNTIDTEAFCLFYHSLVKKGIIPIDLTLHLTIENSTDSYEVMNSRFVLFDETLPVYSTWFDTIIFKRETEYKGIIKTGFERLIRAALKYADYKDCTVDKGSY